MSIYNYNNKISQNKKVVSSHPSFDGDRFSTPLTNNNFLPSTYRITNGYQNSILETLFNNLSIKQLPTNKQYGPLSKPSIINKGDGVPVSTTITFPFPDLPDRTQASGYPIFGLSESSIYLISSGFGHSVGDSYSVSSSDSTMPAILLVTAVDELGAILNYKLWHNGYNLNNSNVSINFNGGLVFTEDLPQSFVPASFTFIPDKFTIVDIIMTENGSGYAWQNDNNSLKYYWISCSVDNSNFSAMTVVGPSYTTSYDDNFIRNTKKISLLEENVVCTQDLTIIDKIYSDATIESNTPYEEIEFVTELSLSNNFVISRKKNTILKSQYSNTNSTNIILSNTNCFITNSSSSSSEFSSSSSSSNNCVHIPTTPNDNSVVLTVGYIPFGILLPFSATNHFKTIAEGITIGRSKSYKQGRAVGQALTVVKESFEILIQTNKELALELAQKGITKTSDSVAYNAIKAKYNQLFEERFKDFLLSTNKKYDLLWRTIANADFEKVVFNIFKLNPALVKSIPEDKFLLLWQKLIYRIRREQLKGALRAKNIKLLFDNEKNKQISKKIIEKLTAKLFKSKTSNIPSISSFQDCVKRYPPSGLSSKKGTLGLILALIVLSCSESQAAVELVEIVNAFTPDPSSIAIDTWLGTSLGTGDELYFRLSDSKCIELICSYLLDEFDDAALTHLFRTNTFGNEYDSRDIDRFDFNSLLNIESLDSNVIIEQLKIIKSNLQESGQLEEIRKRFLKKQFIDLLSLVYSDSNDEDECEFSRYNFSSLEDIVDYLQSEANKEFDDYFKIPKYTPEEIELIRGIVEGECRTESYCDKENNSTPDTLNIPVEMRVPKDSLLELLNKYNNTIPLPRNDYNPLGKESCKQTSISSSSSSSSSNTVDIITTIELNNLELIATRKKINVISHQNIEPIVLSLITCNNEDDDSSSSPTDNSSSSSFPYSNNYSTVIVDIEIQDNELILYRKLIQLTNDFTDLDDITIQTVNS